MCKGCVRPDCGKCNACLDRPKFGGPGRLKQACKKRVCVRKDGDYTDSDKEEEEEEEEDEEEYVTGRRRGKRGGGGGGGGGKKRKKRRVEDDDDEEDDEDYQARLDDEGEEETRDLIDGECIDLHRTGATDVPAW